MPDLKPRILCSEDDPDSREMICLLLKKEGFETVCPDEPHDVVNTAKEQKVDAFLLDNWMPGVSGVELCRRIREFDPNTPIIFFSGAASQGDIDQALAAGAQAYITKPADFEDVVDAIRSAISPHKNRALPEILTGKSSLE